MMRFLVLSLLMVFSCPHLLSQERAEGNPKPGPFFQSFLMNIAEDGRTTPDTFELWQITGELSGPLPTCSLDVVNFSVGDFTDVHVFPHVARSVTEVFPGVYRIELEGRANLLEMVIEFSNDGSQIVNISGSMRVGTRLQSVRVFQVDRASESRILPRLRNPSYVR